MRILIVGSGGREHALAWKLAQNPSNVLFVAPGNSGTATVAGNVAISDVDVPGIIDFVRGNAIDLVVVGPEAPLVLGLSDVLGAEGVACFGPGRTQARLEGSKAYAKRAMREAGVPTADFEVFDDHAAAVAYVRSKNGPDGCPVVVKADGLAAGKGVVVCKTLMDAEAALDEMMLKKVFGKAGQTVVVEDRLSGEEVSLLAFCDGQTAVCLPAAQDHKAIFDNDEGPNTGGMGAYSPAPILPPERYEEMADLAIRPILKLMAGRGAPFKGVLYAGLMMTKSGPSVLEYNVRFGDPECQPLLARLDSDLTPVLLACDKGDLADLAAKGGVRWKPEAALCLVLASKGYPGEYPKGLPVSGLDEAATVPGVTVFHAGAKLKDGQVVTSGGRVFGVTALGKTLVEAKAAAYQAASRIDFAGKYCRSDIGDKGLRKM